MKIYSKDQDLVINGLFITASSDYSYAIESLFPLIDKLNIQRKIQVANFYKRLEKDLIKGCVMPPITIAFVVNVGQFPNNLEEVRKYIESNINKAFILDGIQRLNTLYRTFQKYKGDDLIGELDLRRPIFINVIVCNSMDNLLYRMITLNNGQKPMSARHQIEILADNIYDFDASGISILTEKDTVYKKIKGAFKKADFIKAYLAFLSNSVSIDNKKIIEEKLDELLANRILESSITEDGLEFFEIVQTIAKLSQDINLQKWFSNGNNLIGFSVGIRESFNLISQTSNKEFNKHVTTIEEAISNLKLSSIKLSRERRRIVSYFFKNYQNVRDLSALELLDELALNIL